jgi:hypothetical protein
MPTSGAALAVAGGAADDLGQHFVGIAALSDHVTVVAVGREDVIVVLQHCAHRHTGGLLADVDMKVAAQEPVVFFMEADAVLLGAPDEQHLA